MQKIMHREASRSPSIRPPFPLSRHRIAMFCPCG